MYDVLSGCKRFSHFSKRPEILYCSPLFHLLNYSAGSAGGESNMSMAVDEEENEMEITRVTGTRGGRKSSKSSSSRGRNKNKQQPIVTITER